MDCTNDNALLYPFRLSGDNNPANDDVSFKQSCKDMSSSIALDEDDEVVVLLVVEVRYLSMTFKCDLTIGSISEDNVCDEGTMLLNEDDVLVVNEGEDLNSSLQALTIDIIDALQNIQDINAANADMIESIELSDLELPEDLKEFLLDFLFLRDTVWLVVVGNITAEGPKGPV